jgi:hypothetical protein
MGLAVATTPATGQQLAPFRATFTGVIEIIGQNPPFLDAIAEAEGENNLFNLTRYDARILLDSSSNPAFTTGQNAFVSDDGNVLFGTFTQQTLFSTDPATIPSTFTGMQTFTGGGGIFAGATGSATFEGTFLQFSPTMAEFTISFTGNVTTVPEPGAVALLGALGVGGSGVALWRCRKRA